MILIELPRFLHPVEQDPDGKTIDTDNTAGPAAVWTLARGRNVLFSGEMNETKDNKMKTRIENGYVIDDDNRPPLNFGAVKPKPYSRSKTAPTAPTATTAPTGEAGKKLEGATSTLFAAIQIYKASGYPISPCRFFDSNEKAMEDIERLADPRVPRM